MTGQEFQLINDFLKNKILTSVDRALYRAVKALKERNNYLEKHISTLEMEISLLKSDVIQLVNDSDREDSYD